MGKRKSEYIHNDIDYLSKRLQVKIIEPTKQHKITIKLLRKQLEKQNICRRERLSLERQIKELEERIQIHNTEDLYLIEKKKCIEAFKPQDEAGKQMKLSLLMTDPVIVNRDRCKCKGKLRVDYKLSRFICIKCANQTVYIAEDCEKIASIHRSEQSTTSGYDSTPSYTIFLNQFAENVSEVPESIMQLLLSSIDNIHSVITHTKVQKILSKHGFNTWFKFDYRLARILNGEEIPVFNNKLIKKLETRFKYIKAAFEQTKSTHRKKMPHFVTILKASLSMEGKDDLVKMFHGHGGRKFFLKEEERIQKCCTFIEEQGGYGMNWSFKPLG